MHSCYGIYQISAYRLENVLIDAVQFVSSTLWTVHFNAIEASYRGKWLIRAQSRFMQNYHFLFVLSLALRMYFGCNNNQLLLSADVHFGCLIDSPYLAWYYAPRPIWGQKCLIWKQLGMCTLYSSINQIVLISNVLNWNRFKLDGILGWNAIDSGSIDANAITYFNFYLSCIEIIEKLNGKTAANCIGATESL